MTGTLFIFPKQRDCTTSSPFSSTALCHLSGDFTIPSSHNIVIFWSRELFQLPSADFQRMYISLQQQNLGKLKLNGHAKVQGLVSTVDESRLRSQAGTGFPWSPQRIVLSHLILKLWSPLLMNSRLFPLGGTFSWSDGEQCLLPVTCWFSTRSPYCRTPS